MRFWGILVVLRLDLGQISFNLVKNAFIAPQLALLAFFSFSFLFAAVIDLLLGLLVVNPLVPKGSPFDE